MGVHGMDPVSGFTTPNLMEAEMNRAMVASAGRLVVLADHTKWGIIGLSAIASLADASVLISDSGLSEEARDVLAGSVGELVIADSRDSGSARAAAYDLGVTHGSDRPRSRRQGISGRVQGAR